MLLQNRMKNNLTCTGCQTCTTDKRIRIFHQRMHLSLYGKNKLLLSGRDFDWMRYEIQKPFFPGRMTIRVRRP